MRAGYRHERRYWNSVVVREMAEVRDHTVDSPAGTVPVRLYRPDMGSPIPVLVYAHGGGYIVGDLDARPRLSPAGAAQRLGRAGRGLSLAPERSFPCSPIRCWALRHAARTAPPGAGHHPLRDRGDSAGRT